MTEPRTEAGRRLLEGGREFIAEAYPDGIRGNDGWSPEEYGAEGLTAEETLSIHSMRLNDAIIAIEQEAATPDPAGLDVERLARAFEVLTDGGRLTLTGDSMKEWMNYAERLAAEYARLSSKGYDKADHAAREGVPEGDL